MKSPASTRALSHRFGRHSLTALTLSVALGGCALPEYRLLFTSIPETATSIEAAVLITSDNPSPGELLRDRVSSKFPVGTTSYRISVDLQGKYDKSKDAIFSAIARDANSCILATGSTPDSLSSTLVADIQLPFRMPLLPTAAKDRCNPTGPVIMEVQRQEQGPFGNTDFRLLVTGWGFSPTDQVSVKSLVQFSQAECRTECAMMFCPDIAPCDDVTKGVNCQTGCIVDSSTEFKAPGEVVVHIAEANNTVYQVPPPKSTQPIRQLADLTIMRGSPFLVSVTSAGSGMSTTFAEQKAEKP